MDDNQVACSENDNEIQLVEIDFKHYLEQLDKAITDTKSVEEIENIINNKGWFTTLKDGVTGKSNQQLAQEISKLSTSLGVTQQILAVTLKINMSKDKYLKSFHKVLTEQILILQNNSGNLDDNQKKSNRASIKIATELAKHLEDKMQVSLAIDIHEKKLNEISTYCSEKDKTDIEQNASIEMLQKQYIEKADIDNSQTKKIQNLQDKLVHKEKTDHIQTSEIEQLKIMHNKKVRLDNTQTEHIKKLEDSLEQLKNQVLINTDHIGNERIKLAKWSYKAKNNLIPVLSLASSVAAICMVLIKAH